jgi:Protein of unknown function (DUF2971)
LPLNNDLRRFWREAGGTGEEGSAAVCMPAPAGCSRVYYLTSAEYATSNVVFRRLKVARFSELNDPFELLAPTATQKRLHLEIRKYRENFDVENGLLCFSSDWIDPVLWSHYGAQHHGICLGFNVPNAALRNVNYQTDRMMIDTPTIAGGLDAAFADAILRTKFESWKYEKEKRMLVPLSKATREGRLFFVSFDGELALAEVILGPLCSLNVKEVRAVVERLHKEVTTFQARLAFNTFHVVPKESTVHVAPPESI